MSIGAEKRSLRKSCLKTHKQTCWGRSQRSDWSRRTSASVELVTGRKARPSSLRPPLFSLLHISVRQGLEKSSSERRWARSGSCSSGSFPLPPRPWPSRMPRQRTGVKMDRTPVPASAEVAFSWPRRQAKPPSDRRGESRGVHAQQALGNGAGGER